jgi:hypothetical protein
MTPPAPHRIEAFTVHEGRERGLTRGVMRGPGYNRPFYGIREVVAAPRKLAAAQQRLALYAPQLWELRLLAERYAPRLRKGQFYSHETALALLEAPTPVGWEPALHVSAYRPGNGPTAEGVTGHRLQMREPAWRMIRGLPVEYPARAWVQTSTAWESDDLIAVADHLVLPRRGLATIAELRAEASAMRGHALDTVLADVREGAESFRETQLRLACRRAGLPEPVLNAEVFDASGRFIARIDQLYRAFGVAAEYDGRQHALDAAQFARDADRWDAIRAAGWDHVRILLHHLEPDPAPAVAKIAAALRRGGWRG